MKKHVKKKKVEFSKLMCAIILIYGMVMGVLYYLAIFMNKMVDSNLATQCVITVIGSYMSYILYQGVLKTSLNKNRLTIDKTTGAVRDIVNNDFLNAAASVINNERY